jgi:hypothetical protein
MSNALAIAGVSAVLKDLLNNGLIDHDIGALVNAPVTVTVLPPDRVKTGDDNEQPQLNLFLYQVTPNTGWSNVGLPSRDDQGGRLTNRPLALDLHYLLTAYGKKDFDGEILLGYAMQLLHETPVLSRNAIRTALAATSPVAGDLLPPATSPLLASDLADQVEQIKISPHNLNMEELSKLWTALQGHYRPTAAYHVSVVLIESRQATRAALPVLTRGKPDFVTHRDAGVAVQANMTPPLPTLESLEAPQQNAAIRMGETLTLNGFNLDGVSPNVQFIRIRNKNSLLLPVATASAAKWTISIPPDPLGAPVAPSSPLDPDNWEIGIYGVAGVIGAGATQITTNELPVALAPRIVNINATKAGGTVTLSVKCSPKVWQEQEVSLIIGDQVIVADAITVAKTDTLTFKSSNLPSGAQWVRLRVDGIDSILIDRTTTPPSFDATQQIVIPP